MKEDVHDEIDELGRMVEAAEGCPLYSLPGKVFPMLRQLVRVLRMLAGGR